MECLRCNNGNVNDYIIDCLRMCYHTLSRDDHTIPRAHTISVRENNLKTRA